MRKWKLEIAKGYRYGTGVGRYGGHYGLYGTHCMIFTVPDGKNVWSGIANPETIQDLIDKHNEEVDNV